MMVKGYMFFFSGNYFQQDIIAIPNDVINIYCVYELDPIDFQEIMNLQFKMFYLVL